MKIQNRLQPALLSLTIFLACVNQAHAALVYVFSDLSSDTTPSSVLNATLSFSVSSLGSSSGNDLLTLTLQNQTASPDAYVIDEVFLNFSGDTSTFGFDATNTGLGDGSSDQIAANGFGTFDASITNIGLASGNTEIWQIDLGVTGVSDNDFHVLSINPTGFVPTYAALKFIQGPNDDSAYGAVVPVPAALWLFGSGVFALIGVARRNKL